MKTTNHFTNPAIAALHYAVELGWALFPVHTWLGYGCSCDKGASCDSPAKHPRTGSGGFELASSHPEQIGEWWDRWPDANIGLFPGASGLVIIDVDGPEGEAAAAKLGLIDACTLEARTGRDDGGRHLYYRSPDFGVSNRKLADHLDVRGDSGYVVIPPSVHRSGRRYTWSADPLAVSVGELPEGALSRLREIQEPAAKSWAPAPTDFTALVRQERSSGLSAAEVADRMDRRIRAYLKRAGARAQGDRNNAAFGISAWLVRDFGLDAEIAWAYLEEWNAGNAPPLPQRELWAVFRSASKHAARPVGCALDGAA
jgi:hypothetical protein